MSLKEVIIAVVTTFFPMEIPSDYPGYCNCEFKEARRNGHTYEITHKTQGKYYCSKEAFDFFTGRTSSLFPWKEGYQPHVSRIRKWRYSWGDYVTLSSENKKYHEGCWK